MKFSWLSCLAFLAIISVTAIGCKDDNVIDLPEPAPPAIGGKGGDAVLRVVPTHNGVNIDSCFVYIKYNSLDMPASNDDSLYCTLDNQNEYSAQFKNLKAGNYFLFAKGWDVYTSEKVEDFMYQIINNGQVMQNTRMPLRVK